MGTQLDLCASAELGATLSARPLNGGAVDCAVASACTSL